MADPPYVVNFNHLKSYFNNGVNATPLADLALRYQWQSELGQRMLPTKDITNEFWAEIIYRMNKLRPAYIEIFGETGSGKSSLALSIAEKIRKLAGGHMDFKHVYDDSGKMLQDIVENMDKLKEHDVYICDETDKQREGMGSQSSLNFQARIEKRIRAKGIWIMKLSFHVGDSWTHFKLQPYRIKYDEKETMIPKSIGAMVFYNDAQKMETVYLGTMQLNVEQEFLKQYFKEFKKDILTKEHLESEIGSNRRYIELETIGKKCGNSKEWATLSNSASKLAYIIKKYPFATNSMHEQHYVRQIAEQVAKFKKISENADDA